MGRRSTVALATAAAAALLVSLPLLLVLPPDADTYEQESRQMFVEWKARHKKTYKYAGEDECRYANFKESRCRIAWKRADGDTTSGLNGLAARSMEEIYRGYRVQKGEATYEQETRRMFVGWKAKYGKTYRDVGEEECRYRLFKGNRRVVVRLNDAAAGQIVYAINQFGDLTNEEVRESCYPEMVDQERSARCQAIAPDPDPDHGRRIWYQVCQCIAMELKQTEPGGSAVPGDEAHMWI
ncbi:hypothetical protein BDA96_04G042800 [Sorghum bicolor]|uniref:Cathepsin propeptide inhibitor domain-containing protein n=1 Tax=Sorghum bicolor TaxID=4558 RepID=A0A921R0Z4_SORBI|nr:hypothetical protein BDA96_04G042800 [Sorghum bicolor]